MSFDVANENWVLILPMSIELWYCQWELGFEWIAMGLNHGLQLWIWIPLIKFVLSWTWIMGFSNIGKYKYSWVLNIIRGVYLKVDRWYLNKIRCDKKKYPNNNFMKFLLRKRNYEVDMSNYIMLIKMVL